MATDDSGRPPDERRHDERRREGLMRDSLIAGLATAAVELSQVGREVLRAANLTRLQRWVVGAVLLLGTVAAIAASIDGIFILRGQHQGHETGAQIKQTTDIIKDCTTPTGACYRRSQASQVNAIGLINKFTLIAVECAHAGGTDTVVEACVLAKSKQQGLVK